MTVQVRGIYATALTQLLGEDPGVVQASESIRERFDREFPPAQADAVVSTTDDRQGVGVVGDPDTVDRVVDRLCDRARDALAWPDPTPGGAVYAGEVVDTLGSGAIVDLGEVGEPRSADQPDAAASGRGEGFLPHSSASRRVENGDRLRVQVTEPGPPWGKGRPVLDTTFRVQGSLATLVRGATTASNGPALADILPTDPLEGWGARWDAASDDADLDALAGALEPLTERAAVVVGGVGDDDAPDPADAAPHRYATDEATTWVWFGREARFALDDVRREVTTTMPGHHRTKAGTNSAAAAVDFVEALVADEDVDTGESDFPFDVLTRQFGPHAGDAVDIAHGKPNGSLFTLGEATVESVASDGTVTLRREMTPGGRYDGLGVERQAGDVAVTKVKEGRWWYPTTYEGNDGERRGTYVNVCTPVEVFPGEVRYVDLHVDVVKHADGTVERVDDDELDDAVDAGHVSEALAEKTREVAASLVHGLR
jgi:protein associated with RNAse G/E